MNRETGAIRLPTIVRGAFGDLRRSLPDVVLFELLFQALAFAVLSPLVAWLFSRFVALSGSAAVGNFEIIRFLLTPLGLGLGAALLTLFVALSFANVAGLFYIAYAAAQRRRVTYLEALRFVAASSGRLMGASFLTLLALVAAALPFVLVAGLIAWKLLTEHDINYYLELQPPEFRRALVWGAVLGILMAIALALTAAALVFVIPESLLASGKVHSAIPRSIRLARGNLRRILALLVGWVVSWQLASVLLNGGIYLLGRTLVRAAGDRLSVLLTTLGSLTAASFILNFALALLAIAIGCGLLARLYRCAAGQQSPAPPMLASLPPLESSPHLRVARRAPLAIALTAIAIAAFVIYQVLAQVRWDDRVEISAHRGASLTKPENTASAVRQAIEYGATYVEIDVQLTSDGRVVLAHDNDMMRMAGSPLVINQATYDELRSLEFTGRFSGERVATLEETIDLARDKVRLIVELKTYGSDPIPLIEAVLRTLREEGMFEQAVVMSFEYNEVLATKERAPGMKVGLVAAATLGDLSRLNVDFLAVARSQATNTLIAAAHAREVEIFVWTINDRRGMTTMIDRGVDNIITDDPGLLAGILRERRSLEPAERLLLRFRSLYVD
jgi:glycerophosphoryl diester phosphodiesterase